MTRNKSAKQKPDASITVAQIAGIFAVITAVVSLITAVATSLFSYFSIRTQIELPIQATKTAEAQLNALATHSINTIPSITASPSMAISLSSSATAPLPTNVPSSVTPLRIENLGGYRGGGLYFLPDVFLPPDKFDWGSESMSLPAFNILRISVTNQSDTTLILNNQLPIQLIDFQSLEGPLNSLFPIGGGLGHYRNFVVDIPSTKSVNIVWAVFDEIDELGQPGKEKPDFFTLQPGEVEAFSIEIRFDVPGKYEFRPGIEYFKDGETIYMWVKDPVIAYLPQEMITWDFPSDEKADDYVQVARCSFNFSYNGPYPTFNNSYSCDN